MTEPETPDALGWLFGGSDGAGAPSSPVPEAAAGPARAYPSRRELRAAGAYATGVPAEQADAIPVAPAFPPAQQVFPQQAFPPVAPPVAVPPRSEPIIPTFEPFDDGGDPRAGMTFLERTRRMEARIGRAPAVPKRSLRQRLGAGGVMLLVGGFFLSVTLPAQAQGGDPTLASSISFDAQEFDVSAVAKVDLGAERDGYTSTSASELRTLYQNALRDRNMQAYLASGAKELGDDYPFPAEIVGVMSPLGYYYRECVDFVAWRLNRDAGATHAPWRYVWQNLTPAGGDARRWKYNWINRGWPTGHTPKVGAVAWFTYNHVAYVSGLLPDGSVLIEEYNGSGTHVYGQRIIPAGQIPLFLYAPPS